MCVMVQNLSIFKIRNIENSSPFLLLMTITKLLPGSFSCSCHKWIFILCNAALKIMAYG